LAPLKSFNPRNRPFDELEKLELEKLEKLLLRMQRKERVV
jgi:hypothetical protein